MKRIGIPDSFVEHGSQAQLRADLGLDAAGIGTYLRTRLWEGCAGAYAVLDRDDPYVQVVSGTVSNVIGLPMESLARWLPLLASP